MIRALVLVAVVALAAAAQEHLERGLRLYDVQQYDDAIREFRAGYALDPSPQLLYALGQALRKKGDCPAAVEAYRAYLRTAPSPRQAQAAEDQIARCEASAPPPSPAPAVVAPRPRPHRRVYTWIGVGLTVATVAAGTALELVARDRYDLLARTCAPPGGPGCSNRDIDALGRQLDAATGLFIAAGAVGVATIVAIVLESRRHP